MAFADTQKLIVELNLAGNFTKQLGTAQKALGGFGRSVDGVSDRLKTAGHQIGTGLKNAALIGAVGVAALSSQVLVGLRQLAELEKLGAQTNAVIKSTGGVAQISAQQVRNLAEKYENLNAIIDDKVIQSGENLLLTFTNIKKDAFEPTLQAALDMSTALGQDLNTSVLQLGKALSDPAKGLLALRRAGVIFSADQEKRIKRLQKEGKLWEAQQVILAEVGREFGGSFAAQGKTAEGAIAGIGDAVEDLQKALATALFPTIQKVLPKIRDFLTSPALQRGVEDLGKGIAGLFSDENIAAGMDIIKSVFNTAKTAAPIVAAAAKTMAGIVQTAVGVFKSLPPEIQQLAVGAFAINKLTGGLVTNIAGGLISAVLKQFSAGLVNVTGQTVVVNGAVGGVPGVGGKGGGAAPIGVGTVISAASILAIGFAVGQAIEDAAGGPNGGQGHVVAEIAGVKVAIGQSQAALAHPLNSIEANTKNMGERVSALNANVQAQTAASERSDAARTSAIIAAHGRVQTTIATTAASNYAALQSARAGIITADGAVKAAVDRAKAAISDTASETRAVAAAVRAKKLSVTTNVSVVSKVSVQQVIKSSQKYKSVYNVAS